MRPEGIPGVPGRRGTSHFALLSSRIIESRMSRTRSLMRYYRSGKPATENHAGTKSKPGP